MSENNSKKLNGFAHMIYNQFERPLKDFKEFKEQFKAVEFKLFFNITDTMQSALLIIDKGTIKVEEILTSDKEAIDRNALDADAFVRTDVKTFMQLGELSTFKTIGKIRKGLLKIKGGKNLKVLEKLRTLAEEAEKDISNYF